MEEEEAAAVTMSGVGPETESVQDDFEPQASTTQLSIPESITVLFFVFFFSLYPASFGFITRQQVFKICENKFHLIKFKVSTQKGHVLTHSFFNKTQVFVFFVQVHNLLRTFDWLYLYFFCFLLCPLFLPHDFLPHIFPLISLHTTLCKQPDSLSTSFFPSL